MSATDDALLDRVLETLIPASEDGRMPSAGALDLAAPVRAAADAATLEAGLDALRDARFEALDLAERTEVLQRLEATQAPFVQGLYLAVRAEYYAHPKVLTALGLSPGPPFPKGHALAPGNLDALERVRQRGRLYREA